MIRLHDWSAGLLVPLTLWLCMFTGLARAQGDEVLTNESIIQLTKAGLNSTIIVGKVRSSKTRFDLSTSQLVRLKQLGVREEVIEAMMASGTNETSQPTGEPTVRTRQPAPATASGSITLPHEPGIYLVRDGSLLQLEPTVYTRQKTSGMWKTMATSGIAKMRLKAVVAGKRANVQVGERTPTFFFCFGRDTTDLGPAATYWPGASSPNEFVLLKMDVVGNGREVQTGQGNAFGADVGVSDKQVREFDSEKIATGLYRVTPRQPLEPGEYCFFSSQGAVVGYTKVFDFSVRPE